VKFRCDRDILSESLQTVQRGVSTRPGIPALTGVMMELLEDGTLTLVTTDLEDSVRLTLDVQRREAGQALVPAKLITDIVKNLAEAPVEVETDERSQAWIRCEAYEGTIRLLPASDFPILQAPTGTTVDIDVGAFAEAVSQVGRAASRDETRPILTGVLLEVSREGITMAATDSYRLAVRDLTATAEGEMKVVVPERALGEAGRAAAAEEKGTVRLTLDESQASFAVGRLALTSRLIEGEFPNFRQLLPERYENKLTMPKQSLLNAVKRVGLLARDNSPVKFEFNGLGVKLSSSSPDLGEAMEAIQAQYEGQELTAAFNPNYLAEGLAAVDGDVVRLEVRDGLKPGVIRGEKDDFTYLVMPVRLLAPVG